MVHFSAILLILVGFDFCDAQSFRSILIERACAKKPDLAFCSDFVTVPPTLIPTMEASEATTTSPIPLVLPPNPSTVPPMTSSSAAATEASASAEDDSVDFGEETASNMTSDPDKETLGSLVRLPKPSKSESEIAVDKVLVASGASLEDLKPDPQTTTKNSSVSIEDDKGVLVFVSEYCVVEREHFVKSCNGDIEKKEIAFCKTYPSACVSTNGVIPVISYCQRYYKHYPKHCTKQLVPQEALQFCFAFEQFCLPELHAASQKVAAQSPKSSLRKCEEVLPEARKVCNPFPNPKDTFNLLRCTQFLTNCKKFVDWL